MTDSTADDKAIPAQDYTHIERRLVQHRKRVGEKYCGGIICLPGKGGKCVACADEE